MRTQIVLGIGAILLAGGLTAAFGDVLETTDGKRFTGDVETTEKGYRVKAPEGGTVELSADKVLSVRYSSTLEAEYQTRAAKLSASDAQAHYRLAIWCEEAGLPNRALEELKRAVAINPDHESARASLGHEKIDGKWLTLVEANQARGLTLVNDQWITRDEAEITKTQSPESLAKPGQKAILHKLSNLKTGDDNTAKMILDEIARLDREDQLHVYQCCLLQSNARARALAAEQLGEFSSIQAGPVLTKSALVDSRRDIREAAVAGLLRISNREKIDLSQPFMEAIQKDPREEVRASAAYALGEIGGSGAVRVIASDVMITYGSGNRNHLAVISNRAYIADYDVQIATGTSIYDPVVQTLQEGFVIDSKALRITRHFTILHREIAINSLKKLTDDESIPMDEKGFREWWNKNKGNY